MGQSNWCWNRWIDGISDGRQVSISRKTDRNGADGHWFIADRQTGQTDICIDRQID